MIVLPPYQFLLGTVQLESHEEALKYGRKCQFLLGTVQQFQINLLKKENNNMCQFLLGTVQRAMCRKGKNYTCQFLLGTVQQQSFPTIINIVLYFFQKFNHFSFQKSVDLFFCLTLIVSI